MGIVEVRVNNIGAALDKLAEHCGGSKTTADGRMVVEERNENGKELGCVLLKTQGSDLKTSRVTS
jgi:hypothetical protein